VAGLVLLSYGASQKEAAAAAASSSAASTSRLPHQSPPPAFPRSYMPAVNAVAVFTLLLLLVRAVSLDPPAPAAAAFPDSCTKLQGCGRVAVARSHRAGDETPLKVRTSLEGARRAVVEWVQMGHPRAEVLNDGGVARPDGSVVVHARFVTMIWGFAGELLLLVMMCGFAGCWRGWGRGSSCEILEVLIMQ